MSEAYRKAGRVAGGCPIEAGLLLKLADNECGHGRLPGDRTPPCGCWGVLTVLDVFNDSTRERERRRARVAEMYLAGMPIKGIAGRLGVGPRLVERDLAGLRKRGVVGWRRRLPPVAA